MTKSMENVVVGIDGGGTYTRVAVADPMGKLLSYVKYQGGASFYKNANAAENVGAAIRKALDEARCRPESILEIAAGIAGYDDESDLEWVWKLIDIPGLHCTPRYVNDAVIAHRGALLGASGIVAIAGTGSIGFGITETGRQIRNYDFHHYAETAARHLAYNLVYEVIAGETDDTDEELLRQVFAHFGAADLRELAERGSQGFAKDNIERKKLFGDLAPRITQAARQGSRLAQRVCHKAAEEIVTEIKLVGACFGEDPIRVAIIGSVGNSPYIYDTIQELLVSGGAHAYELTDCALPPVLGAVILALQGQGISINETIQQNLKRSANDMSIA